jgi:predicted phage tail protein
VIKRATTQDPVLIVNEGNARNVRVQYVNRRTQANEWRGQFLHQKEDSLWQMDTTVVQSTDAVLDNASLVNFYAREGRRTDDLRMVGVIRSEQVRRDLNFRKRYTRNSNKILSFEVPIEAIGTLPGRVFGFAHHVLGVVGNGRTLAGVASGGTSITLDRDITIGSGVWAIHVRTDNDTLIERVVTSGAGNYARGASISISGTWGTAIQERAPYVIGIQGSALLLYEITKWRMLKENYIEIEGMNYNPDTYVESDAA